MSDNVIALIILDTANGQRMAFKGRDAWTLWMLIAANENGVTPIERPAPRWSEYVRRLRRAGLIIETITEKHGGDYKGSHGRYVMRSVVDVLAKTCANDNPTP